MPSSYRLTPVGRHSCCPTCFSSSRERSSQSISPTSSLGTVSNISFLLLDCGSFSVSFSTKCATRHSLAMACCRYTWRALGFSKTKLLKSSLEISTNTAPSSSATQVTLLAWPSTRSRSPTDSPSCRVFVCIGLRLSSAAWSVWSTAWSV